MKGACQTARTTSRSSDADRALRTHITSIMRLDETLEGGCTATVCHGSVSILCETSHGLTPRTKVRFITMGGRSKLVKAARSVSAAARAASSRRRARAAGASRALPPLDQSRPPTMGALRRKSGGTRFRSNEWGEPRSTRGSSATAAPACWEHVPRTHSHAPHSGRTHKTSNPRAPPPNCAG